MSVPGSSDTRQSLAAIWNAWLHPREIEKAKQFAATATDDECAAELERLRRLCKSRLEQWRWSQ